ncbi:MAG: hypothetical protein IPI58_00625 [Alphaproteobacteria bacterium]|nr:MAG: hypothetical protein IPI58_00625 [Alphaproteobacteria bacterium]
MSINRFGYAAVTGLIVCSSCGMPLMIPVASSSVRTSTEAYNNPSFCKA